MITSISYLPNTISISVPTRVQAEAGAQNSLVALQNKESSAITQLSVYGQVKSSLADLQNQAAALKAFNKPPTFSDFQAVVQSFVQSFNSMNQAVNDATTRQVALESGNRSRQAFSEVSKATFGSNQVTVSAMQNLGVAQQNNGSLTINQNQLEKNFQASPSLAVTTLASLSNRVSIATNKQLSDNGLIGKAINDLSTRVGLLGSARSAVQGYLETQKIPQQSVPVQLVTGAAARNAVATYAGVAAL